MRILNSHSNKTHKFLGACVALTFALILSVHTNLTYAATNAPITFTHVIKIGMEGGEVAQLQQFLKDESYFTYPSITGYFGTITEAAVAAFQRDHNLEAVGYTGPKTRALIFALSSNTATSSGETTPTPISGTAPACFAPPGLSCIPGTSVIQPFTFGSGYTPGFGGGGVVIAAVATTPSDTTAPIITSIATSSVTSASATITWTTDEVSDSRVDYGTDNFANASTSATSVTAHTITLTGLASNTTYQFRVLSTDAEGNVRTSTDGSFTTTLPTYTSIAGIGDSVAAGVGASISANRWLNLTQSAVGASILLNQGISGTVLQNSAASGGASLSSNGRDRYATALLGANKKDAVFFAYGFNDARYVSAPATFNVANYLNDMREVMNGLILGGYSRADLYLLTPYYITDTGLSTGSAGFVGQSRSGFEAYVTAVQTIAREYGTKFINVYTYSRDHGGAVLIGGDDIHPTDAGHQAIADAIVNTTTVPNTHPALTGVSGSVNVHSVSVMADAPSSGTATSYEFELIDDSTSDAIVVASTTSLSPNAAISVVNGTYRVKARARFADDTYTPWAFSSQSIAVFASETVPPVISSIAVSTTTSTAHLVWNTDESADSRIDFGADASYGSASSSAATSTSHSITLTGLSNGTTYHYRVQSTDVWGNVATSSDQTFTTQAVDTSFVSDTFTDPSGTALTSHTPDLGGTWTVQTGSSPTTAPAIDAAGGLYSRDNASIYNVSTVPTSADYFVEADFVYSSTITNDNVGIALHMSTTTNSYYAARWSQSSSAWQILRMVSGTATVLGTSYVDTFTSGVKHVRFTYTGGALTLAIDGTTRISTNSTAVPYGLAGIRIAGIQTATTGIHLDNFKAGY